MTCPTLRVNILTLNHATPASMPFFKEQRSKNDITLKRSEIPFEIYEQLQSAEEENIKNQ